MAKKGINKKAGEVDKSWHDKFIELYSATCNASLAARGAGVSYSSAQQHRQRFPDFAARWLEAEEIAICRLEAEAWKRALASSDTMMNFLLKANKPEKYREQYETKHAGSVEVIIKREDRKPNN